MTLAGRHSADSTSPAKSAANYLLVGLAAAGLVFAGFGMYVSQTQRVSTPPRGAARAVMAAPVGLESSPALADSGAARSVDGRQLVDVDASGGALAPAWISVEAARPVQIRFSRGDGNTALVVVKELGVSADLSGGSRSIPLPPLEPGTYKLTGADGSLLGLIVAEQSPAR